MGALNNAALLRNDASVQAWIQTAIAYTARGVLLDDSGAPVAQRPIRRAYATQAAFTPTLGQQYMSTAICCDPTVAGTYSSAAPALEGVIIQKVSDYWTAIAGLVLPNFVAP